MAYKISTFSLDPVTIEKLNKLLDFKHTKNKSGIITELIEKEYSKYMAQEESA